MASYLALEKHRKPVIFHREYKEILDLVERSRELIGDRGCYNGQA